MQQLARNYVDGTKPDTPQGVNVANFQAGLGNLWDCLQTVGVGLAIAGAGVTNLTVANAGLILIDASAGAVTLNLPQLSGAAAALQGALFQFKRIDNVPANAVTINRSGTDTIDGQTSISLLAQYEYQEVRADTTTPAWRCLNSLATAARNREMQGIPGYGSFGFRNKIRNPKHEIAQRGTSFASYTTGAAYTLDGWQYQGVGNASAVTVSQQADVPAGAEYQYSLRVAVTTADAAVAAGKVVSLMQPIEGFLVRDLVGSPIALRFDVRSAKTGKHCVALRNSGLDRSYVLEYTIAAANVWQTVTLAIPAGLITAGTWNFTGGAGVYVSWSLMVGGTYQTAAGAWQVGNFYGTANQVNVLDTVGNIFAIGGVQLERGNISNGLEHRDLALETALNQRYYQTHSNVLASGYNSAGSLVYSDVFFKTTMRAAPTVNVSTVIGNNNANNAVINAITPDGFRGQTTITATGFGYSNYAFTASAEL